LFVFLFVFVSRRCLGPETIVFRRVCCCGVVTGSQGFETIPEPLDGGLEFGNPGVRCGDDRFLDLVPPGQRGGAFQESLVSCVDRE